MSILTPSLTYGADSNFEFGTRFIPTKLVEDKEGMIHIFAKKGTSLVPEKIPGLTVTSLDSKIIRVLTVKDSESGFVSEVTVKGIKAGTTKLFLAAPGFPSKELPVTVYGNILIKKDEYFAGTHFEIKPSGQAEKANIYVTAEGMETKSTDITIDKMEDLNVKLYFFREKVDVSTSSAVGHIVVQLQKEDAEEPVLATQDILVTYKITNEFTTNQVGEKTSTIKIKKGEY